MNVWQLTVVCVLVLLGEVESCNPGQLINKHFQPCTYTFPKEIQRTASKFELPCRRLRLCYACGRQIDVSKELCDLMFFKHLESACDFEDHCFQTVMNFYVENTKQQLVNQIPPTWCRQNWVTICVI